MITNDIIERVWSKARIENGYNPDLVRKDACGAWIMKLVDHAQICQAFPMAVTKPF